METLMLVAFALGPVLGLLLLPLTAGLLAFSSRMRSWVLGLCLTVAVLAWMITFVLWGEGFTYANELVDTPASVLVAYELSTMVSATANLGLLGLVGYRLRGGPERVPQPNYEASSTVIYGP